VQHGRELLNLLNHMSGLRIARQSHYHEVDWSDAETFLKSYTTPRDNLRRQLDRAVAAMRRKGWLGSDTPADFRLVLKESVSDERRDTKVALPEIPPAPALGK
jgi:hypothetical protein